MNDAEYEAQKARAQAMFAKWTELMGLRWWEITYTWHRERKQAEPKGTPYSQGSWDCLFACSSDWRYRDAKIDVYLPIVAEVDDVKLNRCVVHECCHILVNETRVNADDWLDHEEAVCTALANAFVWTYDAGQEATQKTTEVQQNE